MSVCRFGQAAGVGSELHMFRLRGGRSDDKKVHVRDAVVLLQTH